MKSEDLQKLETICADFRRFRDNTVDGQGNNLHDIKNTFDYVAKTIDTYQLTGTKFGSELVEKVRDNSKVLSQLWLSLQDLEKTLNAFIENQTNINNQNKANNFYQTDGIDKQPKIYPKPIKAQVIKTSTSNGMRPRTNIAAMTDTGIKQVVTSNTAPKKEVRAVTEGPMH